MGSRIMNTINTIAQVNTVVTMPLHKTLEDRFSDSLEIHIEPYAELGDSELNILQAIADDVPYVDEHNLNAGKVPNPYTHYAIYKRGKQTYVCPIHETLPTCLNPLAIDGDHIILGRWSVGGAATAHELKRLVEEGYLVGYVIKR